MTSVLRSSPAAPMLTSFTIQATLSPLTDQQAGKYPLGPAPPISRQSLQCINMFTAFVDLVSDLPKGEAGQLWYFSVVEAGDEILDLAAPLRCDDAELGKMSPYGVDQHGALAHQQIACPVQHQDGLLPFVLDRHEYHVRPHQRLDDCGSVIGVVLPAVLDVGLDLGWRDQPHLMTQCRDPSGPEVGGSARFHADDTGGQVLKNASTPARRSCRRSTARPVSSTAWT